MLPEIAGHTFYAPPLGGNSVVLDFGASTAGFSHEVSRLYGATCHAVEATSQNFAAIKESERVRKHHFAVGGSDSPIEIGLPTAEEHWGTVLTVGQGNSETVPGTTLESFLNRIEVTQVDLMKVDIEGAEIAMFDTASDEILGCVAQITIEFHDFMEASMGPDVRRVIDRLTGLGFFHVVFTRNFHGDVLFLNPRFVTLSGWQRWRMRYAVKYGRGLSRISSKAFA